MLSNNDVSAGGCSDQSYEDSYEIVTVFGSGYRLTVQPVQST